MSLRDQVQLVRESLEGILEPTVATAVLFDALSRWGKGVPSSVGDVLELVRGPLTALLHARLGPEASRTTLAALEEQLLQIEALEGDLEVEIDFDDEDDDAAMTVQMVAVAHPVSVLVVADGGDFGARLTAAIGAERVYAHVANDVAALRHAVFSASPLIVVIDCAHPIGETAATIGQAIRRLPDAMLSVIWGEETPLGQGLRAEVGDLKTACLFLDSQGGIEPLHDLILSRFQRRQSTLPPPGL